MSARLVYISPEELIIGAVRKCYLSDDKSDSRYLFNIDDNKMVNPEFLLGTADKKLIQHIIESGHSSTLEHSLITFDIEISRGCLQELSRHRVSVSPSVQSTRYTLKKILYSDCDIRDHIVSSSNASVDQLAIDALLKLRELALDSGLPNDILKYGIPEALKIQERISFNFRSFNHAVKLRKSPKAHFEIRELFTEMESLIPESHKIFLG